MNTQEALEWADDLAPQYAGDSAWDRTTRGSCKTLAAALRAERGKVEKAVEDAGRYEMDKHKAEARLKLAEAVVEDYRRVRELVGPADYDTMGDYLAALDEKGKEAKS